MAQALTLLEAKTSTPTGSVHPKITWDHGPCYIQNTSSATITFTCDAPHAFKTIPTGSTNGELLDSITRTELRQRFDTTGSGSDASLLLNDGTDTGYDVQYAVTSVGYIDADTALGGTAVVTGTITTAVTKTATFTITDSNDVDKTPRDNGGEAYTLEYVTTSSALTSATITHTLRDFVAGDKIIFDIEGQDGSVSVSIPVVAGDLTSHNEISTLYVNTNGTETNTYQGAQQCKVIITTGTEEADNLVSHTYEFNLLNNIVSELSGVKLLQGEVSPFAITEFKHANSSSTRTFLLLK